MSIRWSMFPLLRPVNPECEALPGAWVPAEKDRGGGDVPGNGPHRDRRVAFQMRAYIEKCDF